MITDNDFPSMDMQIKTGQLRTKIENEQQQAIIQQQKMQLQVQKAIQKIRVKGSQLHQAQLKFDALTAENVNLINNLRESQRILSIEKERFFGIDKNLNGQKSALRAQKYQINLQTQAMMEKTIQRHQKQLQDLNSVMSHKYERLQNYLKDRLSDKRISRDKLVDIKEDIIKFKMSKESIWDRTTATTVSANKNAWEDECSALEEMISKVQASVKSQRKKGQYLAEELTNFVMKGLKKEQKFEKDIYQIQNKIKDMHKQMTLANVQIEEKQCAIILKQANIIEMEAAADLNRRYIKYIHSQNSVNLDIERLKQDESAKADRLSSQTLDLRIADLQRAVRQQQSQNKMIKNHYQKILSQLQVYTKNIIQDLIFET